MYRDYLTGFSKRKKQKQNEKVKRAVERERDELRKMRAQVRLALFPILSRIFRNEGIRRETGSHLKERD